MLRSSLCLGIAWVIGYCIVDLAWGQSQNQEPIPRSSFGERFQRFRNSLNEGDSQPGIASTSQGQLPPNQQSSNPPAPPANQGYNGRTYEQMRSRYQGGSSYPVPRTATRTNRYAPPSQSQRQTSGKEVPFTISDDRASQSSQPSQSSGNPQNPFSQYRYQDQPASEPQSAPRPEYTAPANPAVGSPRVAPARSFGFEPTQNQSEGPQEATQESKPEKKQAGTPNQTRSLGATSSDGMLIGQETATLVVETHGPARTVIRKKALYKIVLRNPSNTPAKSVLVDLSVKPEMAEIVGTEAKSAGTVLQEEGQVYAMQWKVPEVAPRSAEEITLALVPHQGDPFNLGIQVTQAAFEAKAAVHVAEPKLNMELSGPKEVFYGKQEIFRLVLHNPGDADAEDVTLSLAAANPGEQPPPPTQLGDLKAGAKKVVELELTARKSGHLNIKAETTAFGGLKAVVDESILIRKAELEVAVGGPKYRYAGTEAEYGVTLDNPGNTSAHNLQVVALVPEGASFVSGSQGAEFDAERRKVVWRVAELPAEKQHELNFVCRLSKPGLANIQAAAMADGGLKNAGSTETKVDTIADLNLEVRDPRGPIPVEKPITYEIIVSNEGTKTAKNIEVVGVFSSGLKPVPAQSQGTYEIIGAQVRFPMIDSLAPGKETTLKVQASASTSGNHVFRSELKCPSLEIHISEEESTRFYSDQRVTPITQPKPLSSDSIEEGATTQLRSTERGETTRISIPQGNYQP